MLAWNDSYTLITIPISHLLVTKAGLFPVLWMQCSVIYYYYYCYLFIIRYYLEQVIS